MKALADAVARHLAANPQPPVWSLIVTVFGDMAVTRGGVLSTEGLIRILGLVGVSPPAVRTALSRLVAEGWLEGSREGRRSSYRMTARAEHETAAASKRIYAMPQRRFDGCFDVALIVGGTAPERQASRATLGAAGFGAPQPDCLIRPTGPDRDPPSLPNVVLLARAQSAPTDVETLVATAWDIPAIAARHAGFAAAHAGLFAAADQSGRDPEAALAARLLLIHGWRRLVLRDPGLPLPLAPAAVRRAPVVESVANACRALHAASEAGLDLLTGAVSTQPTGLTRFHNKL
jgi:phenylacetic acid degradation operon negative regulatory protein